MAKTGETARGGWRVISVTLVVSALAVPAALESYDVSKTLSEQSPDAFGATRTHARMAGAIALLPEEGEVAYLTDVGVETTAGTAAFLTAQNALAPRLLVKANAKPAPLWAVGNFSKPADFEAFGRERGYELVRDTGNGVVVYRRK